MPAIPLRPETPRDSRLEEAVRALSQRGAHQDVIRLVEAWAVDGAPTISARLDVARAFFHLRLMDRALSRVREVLEAQPDHRDALRLLAQVFLERGWPLRARKPLQTLRELAEPDVDALWERAQQEAARPEAVAKDVEREGDPARLLALAEAFLSTGSFLRAKGILEKLQQASPSDERLQALLWGLAGEFYDPATRVDALLDQLAPARPLPALFLSDDPTLGVESENTEELDRPLEDDELPANFPSLFKHGASAGGAGAGGAGAEEEENTASWKMASKEELAQLGPPEDTDEEALPVRMLGGGGAGDTQIMQVLRPGDDASRSTPSALHKKKDDDAPRPLNLRELQERMGVSPASFPDQHLEEEDESLVVMTRQESQPPPTTELPAGLAPIEVIEKVPTPLTPPPPAAPAPAAPTRPQIQPVSPETEAFPDITAEALPSEGGLSRGTMLLLGGVLVFLLLLLGAAVLWSVSAHAEPDPARAQLLEGLAPQEYGRALEVETLLGNALDADAPAKAALAEVRLALFSDYDARPDRLEAAQAALASGAALPERRQRVLSAAVAWVRGDGPQASAALDGLLPADDEERLLFARVAALQGDAGAIQYLDDASGRPRYQLGRAEILVALGREEGARKLVQAFSPAERANPSMAVLSLESASIGPELPAQVLAVREGRPSGMPPRLEGRLDALLARWHFFEGREEEAAAAVAAGLKLDGGNPELMRLDAALHVGRGERIAAARELENAAALRPGDADIRTAQVLTLLDLDRAEQARAAVDAFVAASPDNPRGAVLSGLVMVLGEEDGTPSVDTSPDPLAAYLAGLLALQQRAPDAAPLLSAAADQLQLSPDPFLRRLAPRAKAMQAQALGPAAALPLIQTLLKLSGDDPAVLVYIGRAYEAAGEKTRAASYFDRAARVGGEFGLAAYDRGRFYQDAPDSLARTRSAWRDYLSLAPNGRRAARVTTWMGGW